MSEALPEGGAAVVVTFAPTDTADEARAREMMAKMLLAEIRKQAGLTQTDLAKTLGIAQPSLSKLEAQDDMQVSTLRRIINALGGDLELVAHLPSGTVRLSQFKDDLQPA